MMILLSSSEENPKDSRKYKTCRTRFRGSDSLTNFLWNCSSVMAALFVSNNFVVCNRLDLSALEARSGCRSIAFNNFGTSKCPFPNEFNHWWKSRSKRTWHSSGQESNANLKVSLCADLILHSLTTLEKATSASNDGFVAKRRWMICLEQRLLPQSLSLSLLTLEIERGRPEKAPWQTPNSIKTRKNPTEYDQQTICEFHLFTLVFESNVATLSLPHCFIVSWSLGTTWLGLQWATVVWDEVAFYWYTGTCSVLCILLYYSNQPKFEVLLHYFGPFVHGRNEMFLLGRLKYCTEWDHHFQYLKRILGAGAAYFFRCYLLGWILFKRKQI